MDSTYRANETEGDARRGPNQRWLERERGRYSMSKTRIIELRLMERCANQGRELGPMSPICAAAICAIWC